MNHLVAPRLPMVAITVDTDPLILTVTQAPGVVTQPEQMVVRARANKAVHRVKVTWVDAAGIETQVGYAMVDPRSILVTVPTFDATPVGIHTIAIEVADMVGNFDTVLVTAGVAGGGIVPFEITSGAEPPHLAQGLERAL